MANHPHLIALTGAGISASSGIPTYRNDRGEWQRSDPIKHDDFIRHPVSRQKYWARSMIGWTYVAEARPNAAHYALVDLERLGVVSLLVTQNIDRLHQRAGHQAVIDLHGRLDRVRCLDCGADLSRDALQAELLSLNPDFSRHLAHVRPDGDAELTDEVMSKFRVPECAACAGVLMPDVVFFGGGVPRARVDCVRQAVEEADALLVVGSSLKVFSGFRFCRLAHRLRKPLLIINRGETRADHLATLKLTVDCEPTLVQLARRLCGASGNMLQR